ncbi:hypothetical protein ACLBSL_32530, partial [Klebsiella pneumoniae]|uniref:hypothetical protein n=1 Tax=Klebsiella pneumoniae TaxID=573 RepID=UPI003968F1B8
MIIDCVKSGGTWQTYMCRDKMVIEFKSDTGKVVNELIVLVPNKNYWDHQNTAITKVTFVPIN